MSEPCDCCLAARVSPEHATFTPKCLWCGARYLQKLRTFPPRRMRSETDWDERPETRTDRLAWKQEVVRTWTGFGHNPDELIRMSMLDAVPYQPVKRKAGKTSKRKSEAGA